MAFIPSFILLAAVAALVTLAWRGRGTPVDGVPRALWVLALCTLDPVLVLSYLAFAVLGLAAGAPWRRWVVYTALALILPMRFSPSRVPEQGSFPADSPSPRAVVPWEYEASANFRNDSTHTGRSAHPGVGHPVSRAVLVTDGEPLSAMVVERVARALRAAGVPEVQFFQGEARLPAPAADLMGEVVLHDVTSFDLGGLAWWSGVISVRLGRAPFGDNFANNRDTRLDGQVSGLSARYEVAGLRLGPAYGAARFDHVLGACEGLEGKILEAFSAPGTGGLLPVSGPERPWRDPGLDSVFSPLELDPLIQGVTVFTDHRACWRVELGGDPEAALRELEARLVAGGWRTQFSRTWPHLTWELRARLPGEMGERELDVTCAERALGEANAVRRSGTMRLGVALQDLPREPVLPTEYIVEYHERWSTARLEQVAASLIAEGGDDHVLRVLGSQVDPGSYDAWRQYVLAADAAIPNLLNVARIDRDRDGREGSTAALLEVAGWLARTPRATYGPDEELEASVRRAAKDLGVELPAAGTPSLEVLDRAGVPLLGDSWRTLPPTPAEWRPVGEPWDRTLGVSARRFLALDAAENPVVLTLERVEVAVEDGGERWLLVDIDGGARRSAEESALEGEVVLPHEGTGGEFHLRRVDGRLAVRWRLTR